MLVMTYWRYALSIMVILPLLFSCTGKKEEGSTIEDIGSGIVLHGVYQGVLPCADCEGIDYHVQIDSGYTYKAFSRYLGETGHVFTDSGAWEWIEDTIIQLHSSANDHKCMSIHGNQMRILDRDCKWFKTGFEKQYLLTLMEGVTDVHALPISERQNSFYHSLFQKGVGFVAHGSEPDWTIQVYNQQKIVFKTPFDSISFRMGEFTFDKDGKKITSANGDCVLSIKEERCTNTMSGESFFAQVKATIQGKEYSGCGNYLFQDGIEGNWTLVKISDKVIDVTEYPKPPTIKIKDQKIHGYSGCNTYGGQALITGKTILFDRMFSTRMACPNMQYEDTYLKLVQSATSYEVIKNRLVLRNTMNEIVLEYQHQK